MQCQFGRFVVLIFAIALLAACRAVTPPRVPAGATLSPSPSPRATTPAALSFTVVPTSGLAVGDVISVTWQVAADSLQLCMIDGTGPTGCETEPLVGHTSITVTQPMLAMTGIGLSATGGSTIFAIQDLHFACHEEWFFADPPEICPAAAPVVSPAAYQPFEHGFMLWTANPDRFYVMFGDNTFLFADAPYEFLPQKYAVATPPAGLYSPVSGFGKLWRNELAVWSATDVGSRLGWATAPENRFTLPRQCELSTYPGMWACYLQTPDGRVFVTRPDSTAQVHFTWDWR